MIYWQRLSGATDEQFTEAVDRVLTTERFFPSIATLHGTVDRVRQEWETAHPEAAEPQRFSVAEALLPNCETCLDSGWYTVPSPYSNQPGTLTRCECGGAVKGIDSRFHRSQHSAYMYNLDRERALFPAFAPGAQPVDPATSAADLADRLRMDRRRG